MNKTKGVTTWSFYDTVRWNTWFWSSEGLQDQRKKWVICQSRNIDLRKWVGRFTWDAIVFDTVSCGLATEKQTPKLPCPLRTLYLIHESYSSSELVISKLVIWLITQGKGLLVRNYYVTSAHLESNEQNKSFYYMLISWYSMVKHFVLIEWNIAWSKKKVSYMFI